MHVTCECMYILYAWVHTSCHLSGICTCQPAVQCVCVQLLKQHAVAQILTYLKESIHGLHYEEGSLLITEAKVTPQEQPNLPQLYQAKVPQWLPVRDDVACK